MLVKHLFPPWCLFFGQIRISDLRHTGLSWFIHVYYYSSQRRNNQSLKSEAEAGLPPCWTNVNHLNHLTLAASSTKSLELKIFLSGWLPKRNPLAVDAEVNKKKIEPEIHWSTIFTICFFNVAMENPL